jgi:hypothetical protein
MSADGQADLSGDRRLRRVQAARLQPLIVRPHEGLLIQQQWNSNSATLRLALEESTGNHRPRLIGFLGQVHTGDIHHLVEPVKQRFSRLKGIPPGLADDNAGQMLTHAVKKLAIDRA